MNLISLHMLYDMLNIGDHVLHLFHIHYFGLHINSKIHFVSKITIHQKSYLITNTYSSKTFNFRIYAKIYQICICGGGM